jgi:hypothetical protein
MSACYPKKLNAWWELGSYHFFAVNPAPIDNECAIANGVDYALLLADGGRNRQVKNVSD